MQVGGPGRRENENDDMMALTSSRQHLLELLCALTSDNPCINISDHAVTPNGAARKHVRINDVPCFHAVCAYKKIYGFHPSIRIPTTH